MMTRFLAMFAIAALCRTAGFAATVTIDFNGYPCAVGGQVTGPGLENPIPIPEFATKVVLTNLQADQTYNVDLFSDDGGVLAKGSGDFAFVVAADDHGVASVGLGGGVYQMVDGFKPGDTTLKLRTFGITFNANAGLTASYYIPGLTNAMPTDSGPQKFTVVPGNYRVDNLANTAAGLEDYGFVVTGDGQVVPAVISPPVGSPVAVAFTDSREFAEFTGAEIKPRSVRVQFRLETAGPMQYHPSGPATNVVVNGAVAEFDLLMPVGGGGVNLWGFGTNSVSGGTAVKPDGQTDVGTKRDNDYLFNPLLRYDQAKRQFYFVTTTGPSQTVTSEAEGLADDGVTPLKAKVSATIAAPAAPAPAK
jgi:hypothetical protein